MPSRKIPLEKRPQLAAAVAARYQQGSSTWPELEAEFDLTTRTLCILLREAGVEPNRTFGRRPANPVPADDAAVAYAAGASIREVAAKLGRSYGAVHKALAQHPGVKLRPPGPRRAASRRYPGPAPATRPPVTAARTGHGLPTRRGHQQVVSGECTGGLDGAASGDKSRHPVVVPSRAATRPQLSHTARMGDS